jgi:hypothetical protein
MCWQVTCSIRCPECLAEVERESRPDEGFCSRYTWLGLTRKADCPSFRSPVATFEKGVICDECFKKLTA